MKDGSLHSTLFSLHQWVKDDSLHSTLKGHDFFRIASKIGDFMTMGLVEIVHLLKRSDETIFRLTCENVIVTCPSVYEQKKIFCSVSCVRSDRADDIA